MTKSYPEQLAEWVTRREKAATPDRHLAAFLAVKNDVKAALETGWAVKTIWAHMVEHQRIVFSYETFRIYVNRHLRRSPGATALVPADLPAQSSQVTQQQGIRSTTPARTRQSKPPESSAGFTFNPAPNKEDLI
jgi:hypothetical protein